MSIHLKTVYERFRNSELVGQIRSESSGLNYSKSDFFFFFLMEWISAAGAIS